MVSGWRHSCIGKYLIKGIKSAEITNFCIKLPKKADGVFQYQRLLEHMRADGFSGGFPNEDSIIFAIMPLGCLRKQIYQSGEVKSKSADALGNSESSAYTDVK